MLGPVDEVIREVERAFPDLTIIVRGNRVAIVSRSKQTEAQAAQAEDLVNTIIQAAYTAPMDADTVRRMLDQNVLKNLVRLEHPGHGPVHDKLAQSTSNERAHARSAGSHDPTYRKPTVPGVITFAAGVPVRAKTAGQVAYVNAIESHTITFGIGPAGTGKTYLAVAKAVRAFQDKHSGAHYDIDTDMRSVALALGAMPISRHQDRALVKVVIARAKAQGRGEAPQSHQIGENHALSGI